MGEIFLSASVPVPERGDFYRTADPFLIQLAVRQLVIATIRDWRIVWGGHPAITPMVWQVCEDLGVRNAGSFTLYQSAFFEGRFPRENQNFEHVVVVDAEASREASLQAMRRAMVSRPDLEAAVFVGGMEGVVEEYGMFREFHPDATVIPLAATGGAARDLARSMGPSVARFDTVNFNSVYRECFGGTGQ